MIAQDVRAIAASTRPVRRSATTSRSIRRSVSPAARARATACCSTSRTRRTRCASAPSSDSNFSYWHSATFNNDGTKVLFSDEWGGGGQPKCRATRSAEVGRRRDLHDRRQPSDALPELLQDAGAADDARELRRAQRLADSDSGPRRDGAGVVSGRHLGVRLDRRRAPEGDRVLRSRPGRPDAHGDGRLVVGVLVQRRRSSAPRSRAASTSSSSRRARCSRRTRSTRRRRCKLDYLNTQGQPKYVWPTTFALARAYVDQLERGRGLPAARIASVRQQLASAEGASGTARKDLLNTLAGGLDSEAKGPQEAKIHTLVSTLRRIPQ